MKGAVDVGGGDGNGAYAEQIREAEKAGSVMAPDAKAGSPARHLFRPVLATARSLVPQCVCVEVEGAAVGDAHVQAGVVCTKHLLHRAVCTAEHSSMAASWAGRVHQ